MATGNFLVGGASQERVGKPVEQKMPPPQVGVRFIAALMVVGALFVGAGYAKINGVFAARDLEMEASRLQDVTQKRRERLKSLDGRVAELRRGQTLGAAGVNALGMHQPDPATMETVAIAAEARQRWARAAEKVSNDDIITTKGAN